MDKETSQQVLRNWKTLNLRIMSMTEAELNELFNAELLGDCRLRILQRLKQRLGKLQRSREQQELALRIFGRSRRYGKLI